ncbi:MAG TPA: oligosaccharide flippase family protein [Oscillatoriaceae cyanobacterium]
MTLSLRALFANAAKVFAGNVGLSAIAFGQSVLIAKALGPSELGVWGVITSFTALMSGIIGFRVSEPFTRYLVEFKERRDFDALRLLMATVLMLILLTGVVVLGAVGLIGPRVSPQLAEAPLATWLYAATVLPGAIDTTWYCVARDQRAFGELTLLPLVFALLQLGAVVACLVLHHFDLVMLAVVILAIGVVQTIAKIASQARIMHRAYGIRFRELPYFSVRRQIAELRGFWSFIGTTYFTSTLSTIIKSGDMVLLGQFSRGASLGYYRLAKGLVSTAQMLVLPLSTLVYQDFNELLAARRYSEISRTTRQLMRLWVPAMIALVAMVSIAAGPVINHVYGVRYAPAAPLFVILFTGVGFSMMLFWATPLLLALEQTFRQLGLTVVTSLLFVAGGVMLVPRFGPTGMAIDLGTLWTLSQLGAVAIAFRGLRECLNSSNEQFTEVAASPN